jgi:hypothetical protein
LQPLWKKLAGGCHLNRDIPALLREGGFDVREMEAGYLPHAPRFAAYVYRGEAVAAGERLVSEIHSHLARAVAELTSASGARWSKAGALLRAHSATASHEVILALKRGAAGTTALAGAAEALRLVGVDGVVEAGRIRRRVSSMRALSISGVKGLTT